jgi:NTP pyrophosphatase (non-canonical NTP hydrolase)
MKKGLDALTSKIETWAIVRRLHETDPAKQTIKLGEEFGELCQGMLKYNRDQIADSIGDMFVVMTILGMQMNLPIEKCVQDAYDEIKDRKGKMVDGVYVKESDL